MSRESGGAMRSLELWVTPEQASQLDDMIRAVQADARRATWAEAIEAAAQLAIEMACGSKLTESERYLLARLSEKISALTPPEGGGGKETKT